MAADKTVRVELVGGTDQFRKSFADAAKASGDLSKSLGVIEKQISGTFSGLAASMGPVGESMSALGPAGLVAAAGIGAVATAMGGLVAFVGESVKGLVELGGKLSDLSAKTGLSTTTLQELRFAGALVGVSMEEAAGAVGKMQKAIVEGDTVFARLGLSLANLRKLDTAGQFDAVATAIRSIKDPAQQTAAAMEAFGKGGASILPLIKSDTAAAREEFQRLGLSISEGAVAAADKLGDEFTKVSFAFEGVKNQLAAGIVESGALTVATEALKAVMGSLATFLSENKDLIRGFFALGLTAARELNAFIPTVKTGFQGLVEIFKLIHPEAAKTAGEFKFLLDSAAQFQAFKDRMAAARAKAAEPPKDKTFVGKGDETAAAAAAAKALAERQRRENEYSALKKTMEAEFLRQIKERTRAEEDAAKAGSAMALAAKKDVEELMHAAEVSAGINPIKDYLEAINDLGPTALIAQAQLDQLAKEVELLGGVGSLTEAQLETLGAKIAQLQGQGAAKLPDILKEAVDHTKEWLAALDSVASIFNQLGKTGLGDLIGQLGQVLQQAKAIGKAMKDAGGFSKMSNAGKAQTIAAGADIGIGIGVDAYQGASTSATKSVAKGALTGAAKGALAGSVIPGIGTAVGAVVGGVIGAIGGFFGSKAKTKALLKGFDDQLIQQFGSLQKAKDEAKKYGIALDKALDSKKPEAITKAMNELNKALAKRANLEQGLATAQQNVETLQDLTKAIDNPLLKAAVQALATKVADELGKAGLGYAATGPLRDSAAFKGAQDIAGATAGTLGGLRQAGVVDQGVLAAVGTITTDVQAQAFAAAKEAGLSDAEANKASLGAISPILREQLNASIATGRKLDDKTQQLIDEAKANGIDILADPAIEAVAVAKDQLAELKKISGNVPSHAAGIVGVPRTGLALLHRGESVIPANFSMPSMSSLPLGGGSSTLLGGRRSGARTSVSAPVNISINGSGLSPEQITHAVTAAVRRRDSKLIYELRRLG